MSNPLPIALKDASPEVVEQAKHVVEAILRSKVLGPTLQVSGITDIIDQANSLPDKSPLSDIGSVLGPLIMLYRMMYESLPPEDQLEALDGDLLTFDITSEDLTSTAELLGCSHLKEPTGRQPEKGLIVGLKSRILVVRNVTIRNVSRSVTFVLDTGAPNSYVCTETLQAFGINLGAQSQNFIEGRIEGDIALHFCVLDPQGDKRDQNILGMDYLMKMNASLAFHWRASEVQLIQR